MVETDLANADLTGCSIYGISAWRLKLSEGTKQHDLVITPEDEPEVTADDLEVAQFLYLVLHSEKLRRTIDSITSKVVLILGRFPPERKAVGLDDMRDGCAQTDLGYVSVLSTSSHREARRRSDRLMLARMARFVIADRPMPRGATELQSIGQATHAACASLLTARCPNGNRRHVHSSSASPRLRTYRTPTLPVDRRFERLWARAG